MFWTTIKKRFINAFKFVFWNLLKSMKWFEKTQLVAKKFNMSQKMVSHIEILNYKKYQQLTKSITF